MLRLAAARGLPAAGQSVARVPAYVQSSRFESTVADHTLSDTPQASMPKPVRYPYFVSRVGMAGTSLPVYTDIRHGGSKWITQIRKVEGDVSVRYKVESYTARSRRLTQSRRLCVMTCLMTWVGETLTIKAIRMHICSCE